MKQYKKTIDLIKDTTTYKEDKDIKGASTGLSKFIADVADSWTNLLPGFEAVDHERKRNEIKQRRYKAWVALGYHLGEECSNPFEWEKRYGQYLGDTIDKEFWRLRFITTAIQDQYFIDPKDDPVNHSNVLPMWKMMRFQELSPFYREYVDPQPRRLNPDQNSPYNQHTIPYKDIPYALRPEDNPRHQYTPVHNVGAAFDTAYSWIANPFNKFSVAKFWTTTRARYMYRGMRHYKGRKRPRRKRRKAWRRWFKRLRWNLWRKNNFLTFFPYYMMMGIAPRRFYNPTHLRINIFSPKFWIHKYEVFYRNVIAPRAFSKHFYERTIWDEIRQEDVKNYLTCSMDELLIKRDQSWSRVLREADNILEGLEKDPEAMRAFDKSHSISVDADQHFVPDELNEEYRRAMEKREATRTRLDLTGGKFSPSSHLGVGPISGDKHVGELYELDP